MNAQATKAPAIRQLSELFTGNRVRKLKPYFRSPALTQAYIAYFLPLTFHKVKFLLKDNKEVLCPSEKILKIIDFGCGPASAVIALLFELAEKKYSYERIEIDLVDKENSILPIGQALVEKFAKKLKLPVWVNIFTHIPPKKYHLSFATNVLNELEAFDNDPLLELWDVTLKYMLILEPSHRVSSQKLIRFRKRILQQNNPNIQVLSPCCHAEACPLYRTKHWCHFSEPVEDERLISLNRRIFKNPRLWLKFSYLVLKRAPYLPWDKKSYRAIGDVHLSQGKWAIDLCQPNQKKIWFIKNPKSIKRGALTKI